MPITQLNNRKQARLDYQVEPGGKLAGRLRMPGDKSISHRVVMLAALAEGTTRINGLLKAEDVLVTLAAFRAMGVGADEPENGVLQIHGVGLHGLSPPAGVLELGNSGTAMRLMAGMLSSQGFDSELTGDDSLRQRPMIRVTDPLTVMGAEIAASAGGKPPLRIKGGRTLRGINYALPVASAQVKSAILLAGLYAQGKTSVTEPAPTRDHTERMLRGFGYQVDVAGATVSLEGGGSLCACTVDVPGDISSAAFFIVGALIAPGSALTIEHVGLNPTRTGVLTLLRQMGASLQVTNERIVGGEPVGDIHVRHSRLRGVKIPSQLVPLAIDEFPILFIAAAAAEGQTVLRGARELRVKESDRLAVMAEGLQRLGVPAQETADGIVIEGGRLRGGQVRSHGDHRIAMAFAIAGLITDGAITVQDCANVATSFPDFPTVASATGLSLKVLKAQA